jgi:hypothetical protein
VAVVGVDRVLVKTVVLVVALVRIVLILIKAQELLDKEMPVAMALLMRLPTEQVAVVGVQVR